MVLAIRSLYQAQPKLNFETLSHIPKVYARRKSELMQPMDAQVCSMLGAGEMDHIPSQHHG